MDHDRSVDFTPEPKPDEAIRSIADVPPEEVLHSYCGVKVGEADFQRARDLWCETRRETDPDFDVLPEKQRVFGALLSRIVREDERGTIKCPACFDRGLTINHREVDGYSRPVNFARFCEGIERSACAIGIGAEAGYWGDRLRPKRGKPPSDGEKARFLERQRIHLHGLALRDRVEKLIQQPTERSDA